MHLADDADPAVLEAIGDADLPQGTVTAELGRHARVGQVPEAGRLRLDDVPADVEALVVDPDRRVQAEGHRGNPLPIAGCSAEPARYVIPQLVEPRRWAFLRPPERRCPSDVHVGACVLDCQEGVIECGQPSVHRPASNPYRLSEKDRLPHATSAKQRPVKALPEMGAFCAELRPTDVQLRPIR
jgi:hypothetical protein